MSTASDTTPGAAHFLRWLGNFVNLATPAGLLVARLGGCRLRVGPRGLVVAEGYRLPFPYARAFTIGNVIILREQLPKRPRWSGLLAHEEVHTWQYLATGPAFLPLYLVAMAWSWLRTRDRASANFFERSAGLARGGYADRLRGDRS